MVTIVLFGEVDVIRKPPPISHPGAMGAEVARSKAQGDLERLPW